jgi:general L-amino acid transport system substrate-binding protein
MSLNRGGVIALLLVSFIATATMQPDLAQASTLQAVKQRGTIECGVSTGLPGFSDRDANGRWSGFDVDFCHALAAAVFDDPNKVSYVPLNASERFEALKTGKIDVLSRNSSWTIEREASLGFLFAAILYHDGQGFLVLHHPQMTSALELDKAKICVQKGTTSELNLPDFFSYNSMSPQVHAFESIDEAMKALEEGTCDVFTADQSALYAERSALSNPADSIILPDVISKEPLGPVVRGDDVGWFNLVKWVAFGLVDAEELGVTSHNAEKALASTKPDVRRLVGLEGDFGNSFGVDNSFVLRAVKAVGNYGEIFERNLGSGSKLAIPRGLNQLWSTGGVMYAPPMR